MRLPIQLRSQTQVIQATKVVINLEHRVDRRSDMTAQLRRIGWEATFFPAVRPETAGDFPSIGARGCFLSHLEVLRNAARDDRHLVLMEDDLSFSNEFHAHWPRAIDNLMCVDWSIVYPAHQTDVDQVGLSPIPADLRVLQTHFMLINRTCISRIVAALETILARPAGHPLGGPMHVDGAYSTIRAQNPDLTTFVYSPSLGYQRSSRSDVTPRRLQDQVPGIEQLRKVKRLIQPLLKP